MELQNNETALVLATDEGRPAPDYLAARRYLSHLKGAGVAGMRSTLGLAARLMGFADIDAVPWNWLNASALRSLVAMASNTPTERGTPRAPASVTALINAVRGVCAACWDADTMTTDVYAKIKAVKAPRGSRLPAGRNVGAGEKVALMRAVAGDEGLTGRRDAAMLAMVMGTGVRRAELASMTLEDFDLVAGRGLVIGKGDKEREIYLAPGSMAALLDWLAVRGRGTGPLFCPIRKGGKLGLEAHLSPGGVSYIIERRRQLAGVASFTPHDLRRTFAGDMLDAGEDLSTTAGAMGHSDPKTTARYDRRGGRVRAAAASKIEVPYKQPRRAQATMF